MTDFKFSKASRLWLPVVDPLANRKVPKVALGAAARAIRKIFADNGVTISRQCGLGKILSLAERAENLKPDALITMQDKFDSQAVLEIKPALSVLENHKSAREYLRKLVSGSLSSYDKGESVAKNFFWELDVCHRLRRADMAARLDEPDILWDDRDAKVGIACKKVYSDARLQSSLSKAVSQVAKWADYGFVAINIDELVPRTLQVNSWEDTDVKPQRELAAFYERHDHHFRKYLIENRISGMIVACTVRVVINQKNGRIGTLYSPQWQLFTRPGLPEEHLSRAKSLFTAMGRLNDEDREP